MDWPTPVAFYIRLVADDSLLTNAKTFFHHPPLLSVARHADTRGNLRWFQPWHDVHTKEKYPSLHVEQFFSSCSSVCSFDGVIQPLWFRLLSCPYKYLTFGLLPPCRVGALHLLMCQ